MKDLLLIVLPLLFIFIVVMTVKGRDDAKTFDGEYRFVMWKLRNSPVDEHYFKHIKAELERVDRLPKRNQEMMSVARAEFGVKFQRFILNDVAKKIPDKAVI